jgi:hemerythrin-like domain-containing protein
MWSKYMTMKGRGVMTRASADEKRRSFVFDVAGGAVGLLVAGCAGTSGAATPPRNAHDGKEEEEKVSPVEDLMREHGLLNRVLLVYEEGARRIDTGEPLPPETLASAASIIKRFIEEYHEKLEEEHLFPRFEKAGKLVDLVAVLRAQHLAGRKVTEVIQRLSAPAALQGPQRSELAIQLRQFIRTYRPHEAREDTVLFPAFRKLVRGKEYAALGEAFEDEEHALFGEHGFENMVAEVAKLEKSLGIHDLALFTPR